MSIESGPIYEFGSYRLEIGERRLSKDGHRVPLRAKVFDTLRVLVENHGRLVHNNDLLLAVWPDATVEDSNLSHNISELRRAFGERRTGQRFIETVSKSGYRFVAPVREARSPGAPSAPASTGAAAVPMTRYATSGDVHIAYQVLGDGPIDLVYVPGWITHLEYGWEQPLVRTAALPHGWSPCRFIWLMGLGVQGPPVAVSPTRRRRALAPFNAQQPSHCAKSGPSHPSSESHT